MRSRGLSNARCWSCIDPTRPRTPLGAATSPLPTSEPAFPYVARPGSAGLVVRLPRWAVGAPAMPPWGVLAPATRAIRMGSAPPPMDWLPFTMDAPWAPGHLYGEHGGQSPTLDDGPAWWHLYPPTESVAGPFEPPTRHLRLGRRHAPPQAQPPHLAPKPALRPVATPTVPHPTAIVAPPWTWAGAQYSWGAPARVLAPTGWGPAAHVLAPTGWGRPGLGQVPPPLPPEESGGQVVGVPGATPQIDSAGNVVGWYRVNPDGTATMYDAQGNLQESTALVTPTPAGLPSSGPARSAPTFNWATLLYIGGAGAGLFLLMALLQKR